VLDGADDGGGGAELVGAGAEVVGAELVGLLELEVGATARVDVVGAGAGGDVDDGADCAVTAGAAARLAWREVVVVAPEGVREVAGRPALP
jgi:hypothetical protein